MDLEGPGAPLRPAITPTQLESLAKQVRAADPMRPVDLEVPLQLRVNGNSTYIPVTVEIRRHLDHRQVDFSLTARNDLNNGLFTWDLTIRGGLARDVSSLLDWLVPVYTVENF